MKTMRSALIQNLKEVSGIVRNTDNLLNGSTLFRNKRVKLEMILPILEKLNGDRGRIVMSDRGGEAGTAG
ncbi:MAG: hypothetical protein A2162_03010 [Deltaproteobacteria bacterium RBG_13_52_11b]|nr:MAG: hypothetical protein A2162_03010 [Deltaproteobacteria bacterium RBG_13_52_11b]